jgi:hypothetical protein
MSEIEIREITEEEHGLWDEVVGRSPQATITHQYDWLKIIEKHTDSEIILLSGYLGNEIIAAIPFFFRKSGFSKTLSSPIGTAMIQNLGPIFPDYDTLKQDKREFYFREFQKGLDIYIDTKIRPNKISIVTSPNLLDARPYVWNGYQVIPKYNYVKDIGDLEGIWIGFKKQLRKNIEKTEKAGFTVDEEGLEGYNLIIQLVSDRLDKQDIEIPASKEYFLDLYNKFYPDNLKVFIARLNGEPVTGIIVTAYRNKLSLWVGATQTDLKGVYPVDLLQWKIVEWGNKHGYKYCEILGANRPSISYFKSRYNFDLEIYFDAKRADVINDISGLLYKSMSKKSRGLNELIGRKS